MGKERLFILVDTIIKKLLIRSKPKCYHFFIMIILSEGLLILLKTMFFVKQNYKIKKNIIKKMEFANTF